MSQKVNDIIIEGAKIIFRNFSGRETKFNRAGNRNFNVLIEDAEMARQLADDGWNIKVLKPKEEGDEPKHCLEVTVSFKVRPPMITLVTRRVKTKLDEESIETLDYAEINNVDLIIRPRYWEANGKSGIKAYLKTMYVTISEDVFADKYAD